VFALLCAGTWYWMYRAERRHDPTKEEVGLTPTRTFRTGVRIGFQNWSLPLVRVSTYPGFVVIAPMLVAPIVLRRTDRVRVEAKRFLLSTGIALRHSVAGLSPDLRIWPRPRQAALLEAALRRSLM